MSDGPRTCGSCEACRGADGGSGDPFWWLTDAALADDLRRRCGVCAHEDMDAVVVMLGTREADMPCAGDLWSPR